MKRSKLGKTITLAKNCLEEELLWGETETPAPEKGPAGKGAAPAAHVKSSRPQSAAGDVPDPEGQTLENLRDTVNKCRKCGLGKCRLKAVFGTGNPRAELMFVGEGPGFDEDHKGEPFIGRAGQLLTKIIEAIGMKREDVYIANIVKCHPMIDPSDPEKRGNDRPPSPEEVNCCFPYLEKQIELIKPKVICTLGNSSAQTMLGTFTGISKLRGRFVEYKDVKLMPTYHPAALLRNPSLKKEVWEDMKLIRDVLK